MAFSQSFKRGQAPASCNFCEKETKIKWKCLNCDVLMCAKCKDKIHAKLKNSKEHKVIDIKEVGLKLEVPDFSDLKCKSHPDQSCVLFCTTCQRLVCTSCITTFHNGHGFVEISEGYELKKEKIGNELKKAKEIIDELTNGKTMSHIRTEDNEKYKELIKKIETRETYLKNAVEKFVNELKDESIKKWKAFQKEEISHVEKVVDKLQELSLNAEDILQSKDAGDVFNECEKLSMAVIKAKTGPGTIAFLPGQLSAYNVGSLQLLSNAVDVRIVKQFRTDISCVFYLSLCPDNVLWISDAEVVQKVKPVEHKLTVDSTLNIRVFGMAVTPTGDLIFLTNGSVLQKMNGKTGELTDSIFLMETLSFTTFHVTKDGKVIVGVKSKGLNPAKNRRAIIVMNQKGEHETIYELDKNNISILTNPYCITSTDNGHICVVDMLSDDGRGRVVILGPDQDFLQIYTGHPEINEDDLFSPVKIVTTPSDNLIVAELESDIFHILNNCGQLITHYNVGDIGIQSPYSLCFTRTAGQLYIGCTTTSESSEKAKVYEVKISGC